MLDKHLAPNLVALALILISLAFEGPAQTVLLTTGLFALSGALTNWLAVHMLFERVPGLYGSGVIVEHFAEIKEGLLRVVKEQLLNPERVATLLETPPKANQPDDESSVADESATNANGAPAFDLNPVIDKIDLDAAFDELVKTIVESSFGSMLAMVGGEAALQPLRQPFLRRMKVFLTNAAASPRLQKVVGQQIAGMASSETFARQLDTVLRARLDELTPEAVRDIVQLMIRRHLGWLVVWGGVIGGLIGLLAASAQLMLQ